MILSPLLVVIQRGLKYVHSAGVVHRDLVGEVPPIRVHLLTD